ncbi:MAG TPA: hypothetical protein VMR50_18230 [Myxococcota bacterium]|nr:hypothetical protein [Myxococcota bacterium]
MKPLWTVMLAISCAALLPQVAAAKPAIPDPFLAPPCASPDDPLADLSAAAGLYVNAGDKCPAVCRRAEKQCERYVKLAVSCRKDNIQDEVAYEKLSCNMTLTGPEKKACLVQAGSNGLQSRNQLDMQQATDITQCQIWGQLCAAGCP